MAATIITSLALVGVAVVITISQLRNNAVSVAGSRFFVATCFSLAVWLIANILSDVDASRALLWVRVSFASVAIALTCLLLFVNRFPIPRFVGRGDTLLPVFSLIGLLLLIASPLVIPDVTFDGDVSTVVPGPLYSVFVLFVVAVLGIILIRLFQNRGLSRRHRAQVRLILMGILVTATVALITNLLLPLLLGNNNLYWIASVSTLGFFGATAFAIVKEGLFDVRQAAMRSVAYIASLATVIGVYYALVFLVARTILQDQGVLNAALSPLTIVLALMLATTFQPVKRFFDKLTNKLFFRGSYENDVFFAEFGQLLASTTDLRNLLERASDQVASTLKAEQAFFLLHYTSGGDHHMSAGTRRHAKLPSQDVKFLTGYMHDGKSDVILTDFLEDQKVQRMLRSHGVAVIMPLRKDDTTIGYLMLGDHLSGYYTKRDLAVLASVGNGLVVAIQNALSLHEVKELNATLQQRIDVATKELRSSNAQLKHLDEVKDEFMSMASHQLRTPLTSIKGYLSMVLDGDVGKISPQQRTVLSEAFNSSERMVHLISDFLNVSRLQTGKFVIEKALVDFGELVRQEIADLEGMAKGRELHLEFKSVKGELQINADAAKLREVVTNFIDNAIYYSPEHAKIAVHVEKDHQALYFSVVDQGIGVPEAEQSRLFNKFFRATNARKQRPDGTGVGLYLARKVITAHGGAVVFESKEGKGSTFGFRLPLAKSTK